MMNILHTKYATYTIAASLLFLMCPDERNSEEIRSDALAEQMSLHPEYDPDSMHYYYDSQL